MKNKSILISALFVSLFTANITFAEEISEEPIVTEIVSTEATTIPEAINELITENPISVTDPVLNQVLNLDVLLQAFMTQNKDFLEQQKNRLLKSFTKEGSTIIPLVTLLILSLGEPTINYIKNWYKGTPTSFKNAIDNFYKEKQITGIAIPSLIAITAYIIIRSLYFGQKKIAKKVNVNLEILTKVIQGWPNNQDKIAIKLHGLIEQLHDQYLIDQKVNLTEIQAQEIVRKLIDMGFKQLEEQIETKSNLVNYNLTEIA